MLELANQSKWSASVFSGWGKDREFQYTVVVKQSFEFDLQGELTPLPEPATVQAIDEHHTEPFLSSLKAVSENAPFKKGGEFILYGTAYPNKPDATVSPVSVSISGNGLKWNKTLVVAGPRSWKKGLMGGVQACNPGKLEPTPLMYEYAYGGTHPENDKDKEARNPVGLGFIGKGKDVDGVSLPRIENLKQRVTSIKDHPDPAGFGPIPVFWSPREDLNKDIDEKAVSIGDCHYGKKIPDNLNNSAPEDQQFKDTFKGNEAISLNGFFESVTSPVNIKLDLEVPEIILLDSEEEERLTPILDTLVINTDEMQVHCIWRLAVSHERTETEISWLYVRDEDMNKELIEAQQQA